MSIIIQAQREADDLNAANNYKMLQKANELQSAKQAGAYEAIQGLAAREAAIRSAQYATDPSPYAQNAAMYESTNTQQPVTMPSTTQPGGREFYVDEDGRGLAGWDQTRQWLNNTKREN